jgi:hypothetical protein
MLSCWCEDQIYSINLNHRLFTLATVVTYDISRHFRRRFCCRLHLPAAAAVPVETWRRPATEGEVRDSAAIPDCYM